VKVLLTKVVGSVYDRMTRERVRERGRARERERERERERARKRERQRKREREKFLKYINIEMAHLLLFVLCKLWFKLSLKDFVYIIVNTSYQYDWLAYSQHNIIRNVINVQACQCNV